MGEAQGFCVVREPSLPRTHKSGTAKETDQFPMGNVSPPKVTQPIEIRATLLPAS